MVMVAPADAETLTHLHEEIQLLTTAVKALTLKQEEYINVIKPQEKSDNKEDDENPNIEQGFKLKLLPKFYGDQFLDWITTVEGTLDDLDRVTIEPRVHLIATRFRGPAAAWWTQLKASRASLGKPRILSWDKLKRKMCKKFFPFDYKQAMLQRFHNLQQGKRSIKEYYTEFFWVLRIVDLQDSDEQIVARFVGGLQQQKIKYSLSLYQSLTLAEAYQKALIVEAEIRKEREDVVFTLLLLGAFSVAIGIGVCLKR